jgi:hypothetical protein
MRAGLARFHAKRTCHGVFERGMPLGFDPWIDAGSREENASKSKAGNDNARSEAGVIRSKGG